MFMRLLANSSATFLISLLMSEGHLHGCAFHACVATNFLVVSQRGSGSSGRVPPFSHSRAANLLIYGYSAMFAGCYSYLSGTRMGNPSSQGALCDKAALCP